MKNILNYYADIKELLVAMLVFFALALTLWALLFPSNANAGECACYTFPPFEEANCFDTETRKECELQ